MMGRLWRLSLLFFLAGRVIDHIASFRGVTVWGIEAELNPFVQWVIASFGPVTSLITVGFFLGITLAVLNAYLVKALSVFLFGSWVGVRSGIAFNLIVGLLSILGGTGTQDRICRALIPAVDANPRLGWFLGGMAAMATWAGIVLILVCVDMDGLDFTDES